MTTLTRLQSARGMTPDVFHLVTTGHLMASERDEHGWPPLLCADCSTPVDMIWRNDPIDEQFLSSGKTLPGCIWGKDVVVICPKCSFAEEAQCI